MMRYGNLSLLLLVVSMPMKMNAMDPSENSQLSSSLQESSVQSGPMATKKAVESVWNLDEPDYADVSTNEDRGNWFVKAKILKEARKVYEAIRKHLAKIEPLEVQYLQERAKIDEKLNIFYQDYGFKNGELSVHLEDLIKKVALLEDNQGSLDPLERATLKDLKLKQESLQECKIAMIELQKFDGALNQALGILQDQINKAQGYDENAWKDYEKIELVLSDEIAESLLRSMQNDLENVELISAYLFNQFKAFFQKSVNLIEDHSSTLKQQIEELKVQGIALGKKMVELLEKEEKEKAELKAQSEKKVEPEVVKKVGVITHIIDYFKSFYLWLVDLLYSLFSSKAEPLKVQPSKEDSQKSNQAESELTKIK